MGELDRLGEQLLEACATARRSLTLCAPFVKAPVFQRVLDATDASVAIELFTRWRPDEVAAGVSDTAVLSLAFERGGSVLLCDRLHAKFVRCDDRAFLGSANLTATALGWTHRPNLEILTEVPGDTPQLLAVEEALRAESIVATAELALEVDRIAALLPRIEVAPVPGDLDEAAEQADWYPALREPRDLFIAYSTGVHRLSRASAAAAASDLDALQLPPGLERNQFEALVGSRLMQTPLVQSIDAFVSEPQRFGAVRALVARQLRLERESADFVWQTVMRWLLEFLPQRYDHRTANWSEIFVRRSAATGEVA